MTDEELIARLRKGDTPMANHYMDEAADLIEEYGRAYTHLLREFDKRGDRIEALVKERDEMEAEAHAHIEMWGKALRERNEAHAAADYLTEHSKKVEARAERLEAALKAERLASLEANKP